MKPTSPLNQMSAEDSPPGIQRHHHHQQNGKRPMKSAQGNSNSLDATSPTHQQYLGNDSVSSLWHDAIDLLIE